MLRRFGLVLVSVALLLLLQSRVSAQSTANLQADIQNLKSQVSQLQSQISQLGRGSVPPPANSLPRRSSRSAELSDSQIVDRLATLAIEAKDRLNALETRVSRLEKSKAS